ncbi:hypothetical protein BD310DRAFT_939693 [Dichomitus squalens]|uniref:Uncharacterized protein n=1 Tax=Dichomitus squalens TaxID=114155 RepID=A0A4Q9PH13_9APHY|nr:hypothetical protein BD310DRAFT_939802 [Dichomitus squalens]TBU52712.1 hypothetical protein BD310DRAFT_939693 [Dichomitus squalens]
MALETWSTQMRTYARSKGSLGGGVANAAGTRMEWTSDSCGCRGWWRASAGPCDWGAGWCRRSPAGPRGPTLQPGGGRKELECSCMGDLSTSMVPEERATAHAAVRRGQRKAGDHRGRDPGSSCCDALHHERRTIQASGLHMLLGARLGG